MSNQPTEPNADLRMFAAMLWQMYVALKDQGFSEQQALTVIGQVIAANPGKGGDA